MTDVVILLTTWPDEEAAHDVAREWLANNLVACVNILPAMKSLYRWDGELNVGTEHQMLLKTSAQRVNDLQQAIIERHPYECPEILHVPVTGGFDGYLNWIKGNTE